MTQKSSKSPWTSPTAMSRSGILSDDAFALECRNAKASAIRKRINPVPRRPRKPPAELQVMWRDLRSDNRLAGIRRRSGRMGYLLENQCMLGGIVYQVNDSTDALSVAHDMSG